MLKHNKYKNILAILLFFISLHTSFVFSNDISDPAIANTIGQPDIESLIKEIFPIASRIEKKRSDIPVWPVFVSFQQVGYAFETKDFIQIPGFAGDIINLLVGIDNDGKIMGVRILFQHEPIFMHGLGEGALLEFLSQYPSHIVSERIIVDSGRSRSQSSTGEGSVIFDGVTKATVSVIATNDPLLAASLEVARKALGKFVQSIASQPKMDNYEPLNWQQLLDQKLVAHWPITRELLEKELGRGLEDYPDYGFEEVGENNVTDIYYMYLNSPIIGRNVLGEDAYQRLMSEVKPNEHILGVMSEGAYSYLEDDFRPGKIPTRMAIFQQGLPMLIRDLAFYRFIDKKTPADIKDLDNFHLFSIKANGGFDPSQAIDFQLNFDLRQNHLLGDNINLKDSHQLPKALFLKPEIVVDTRVPIWKRLWISRTPEILITLVALVVLTFVFVRQRALSKYPTFIKSFRWGFLLFTLFFIGFYAQGQLSVVNIYTVLLTIEKGFKIDVFLLDPVLFILWSYTFITLFIWGRGLFCGWLCPFGALQEMLAWVAKRCAFPQIKIKEPVHRVLQKIKYPIVGGLIFLCFYDLGLAQTLSEIEPFKTSMTLLFIREWYFVLFAVFLLTLGMFIHKFYCRYVCPLGAGLAVLGRFHIFEWLTRRDECGKPCQVCSVRCEIKAIPKTGNIDYNECIQCLECLVIYNDEHQCAPVMLENKRARKQFVELK